MLVAYNLRKKKPRQLKPLIIIVLILSIIILNAGRIASHFYPFPYRESIYYYAEINNLDPLLLVAVIKKESNFKSHALSKKGARGLMQIMPDTGWWVARKVCEKSFHPDYLFDPETNIRFGAWYLSYLLDKFGGDLILALAAYNGGDANVKKWLSTYQISSSEEFLRKIPFPETRQFISSILWNYRIYSLLYK